MWMNSAYPIDKWGYSMLQLTHLLSGMATKFNGLRVAIRMVPTCKHMNVTFPAFDQLL